MAVDIIKLPCVIERPLGDTPPIPLMCQVVSRDRFGFVSIMFCDSKEQAEAKIATQVTNFPKVITLCGSTRFKEAYERINKALTLEGNIVISVGCFGHAGDVFTDEQKVLLDEIHKRKIDLADAIFVINEGGYIGSSTRSEIEYALSHGKEVVYMEGADETQC